MWYDYVEAMKSSIVKYSAKPTNKRQETPQRFLTLANIVSPPLMLAAATTTTCRSSQHQAGLGWAGRRMQ